MKDTNVSELQQFSLLVPDPNEKFFEISPNTRSDLSVEFLERISVTALRK